MAKMKVITNKDGSTSYRLSVYLGRDPMTGKMVKTNLTAKTQKELNLKVARKKLDFDEFGMKSLEKKKILKFRDIYDAWIEVYENTVKESTFNKTKRIFKNHILPELGDKLISKIDVPTCQKALNKWFKKIKKYNMILNYASNVFDYAISLDYIDINPTKRVSRPVRKIDYTQEKEENFFSKDELKTFLDLFNKNELMYHSFFRLLAFTGLRKGEALALTWSDLDLELKTLKINKALSQGIDFRLIVQSPKTQSSVRTISLDQLTINLLLRWSMKQREELFILGFNSKKKSQLIFSNDNNELFQPTATRKWLIKILNRDESLPKITTHGFRHTHCSLLFEAGRTIEEVKDRLGHSDIQTTMNIYTHVAKEKKEEVAEVFAKYVNF